MAPVSKYQLTINSPNVRYTEDYIESDYIYESVKCVKDEETKTITVSINFLSTNEQVINFCSLNNRQVLSQLQ